MGRPARVPRACVPTGSAAVAAAAAADVGVAAVAAAAAAAAALAADEAAPGTPLAGPEALGDRTVYARARCRAARGAAAAVPVAAGRDTP
eukprot:2912539-Prymnesium_polylepis.2